MNIHSHAIQGAATVAALYPVIQEKAFIVGFSVVAIDIDHYIQYVWDTGKWSLGGMFRYFDMLRENLKGRFLVQYLDLCLFHTIECYLTLFALGIYVHEDFIYILMGFIFHHLFDQLYFSYVMKWPFVRAFSIVEYLMRKKGRYTSLDQVIQAKARLG